MKKQHFNAVILGFLSASVAANAGYKLDSIGYWVIAFPMIVIGVLIYNNLKK